MTRYTSLSDLPVRYQKQVEEKTQAPVAQRTEHVNSTHGAEGSNPSGRAKSKYKSKKTVAPTGETFDSKAEYERWLRLLLLYQRGYITKPMRQVSFPVGGGRRYQADFVYINKESGEFVVEDVKGFDTPLSATKRDILSDYGIDVKVIK